MNEEQFQNELKDVLDELDTFADIGNGDISIKNISSFEDAMLLTQNKGLIVKLDDDSVFQLTIVQIK